MGKIMKPNKVVVVLAGRHAGKKGVVVKTFEGGQDKGKAFSHALVAGIERYPRKVTRRMSKKKVSRRCRIKPFVRLLNYNHLMPTRYSVELKLDTSKVNKDCFREKKLRRKAREIVKNVFEQRYKTGKNKWFFQKLRF
ncbi:Ribosomal protein L27 [Oopsacas minuta]|uniref:60S ribosomal protein L27 n=1 Tax=Oopsacas minuta TaxID=111878 RepID=A0AAV7JJN8_9METZ|nr:Ribosomal protein L27 [Oopsacas minuta]